MISSPPSEPLTEEEARLRALRELSILDTEGDAAFDGLVLIASRLCHAPVALISLVERDRQWFLARLGLEVCETPISQSVCAHAMGGRGLLIIPDLTADPRTRDNTLVTEDPRIRFYAGAPLITASGHVIGTLCVIDTVARPGGLSEGQGEALAALAHQAMTLMEARAAAERRSDLARWNLEAEAAARDGSGRIGSFEIDLGGDTLSVSPEFCRIFGLPVTPTCPREAIAALVLAEDRPKGIGRVRGVADAQALDGDYRILRANDKALRWIARRAEFHGGAGGGPLRITGTVQDITDAKRAAARLAALLELGERMRDVGDVGALVYAAAEITARALGASRAGFGLVDAEIETLEVQPEWCAPGVRSIAGPHRFRDYGSFIDDLKRGDLLVVRDVRTDPRTRDSVAALEALGIRVLINVPVLENGRLALVAFLHYAEPRALLPEEMDFLRVVSDRTQAAIARIRAEQERALMHRELGHRLKNSLAMVQAIAGQTLRGLDREPVAAFEKRLRALSSAHDVLMGRNWTAARVGDVVEGTLRPLGLDERTQYDGPPISIGPRAAVSLSMLLHEFATNALKHGAYSTEEGRVAIGWAQEGEGPEAQLSLAWVERGGPVVIPPESTGFGSKLMRIGLLGAGGVSAEYAPEGFSAEVRGALEQLRAE